MIISLLSTLLACEAPSRTPERATADLRVTVRTGTIAAPNSARPGWTRVRVEETEGAHIVVVFRIPASATSGAVTAFVAALDTAPKTPSPGMAIGGPEVGGEGDVIVNLTAGVYVLACVRRGDDGHRHASIGEFTVLHVQSPTAADSASAIPPPSTNTVRMVDFAYVGTDHWAPGLGLVRIENTGRQDHQLRLARLREGASLQTWMQAENPDSVATTVAGMARVGAGQVAFLPVDLTPGSYVVYCLVADATTKRPHIDMGMLRAITVP